MSPVRIGLVVAAGAVLAYGLLVDVILIPFAAILGIGAVAATMKLHAIESLDWPDPDDCAPTATIVTSQPITISDELLDLLKEAGELADRALATSARIAPYVVYEDLANGALRVRRLAAVDGAGQPGLLRQHARGLHPDISRLVLVALGEADIGGRSRSAVLYEAAERTLGGRTHLFAQRYDRKRPLLAGGTRGRPHYLGESPYPLRPA